MLIDPFTVIAQIVNFAILAFALKHFLYARVITAMDEREASIAERLHAADDREAAAAAEIASYERLRTEFEQGRRQLLTQTEVEAAAHAEQLQAKIRQEAAAERQRWRHLLENEQQDFRRLLRRRTADEVLELSRRALHDLAHLDVERAVVESALDRLADSPDARAELGTAAASGGAISVRTAFVLPLDLQQHASDRVAQILGGPERPVLFETDPELIVGVEFRCGGTATSWNASDYLERLAESIDRLTATLDAGRDAT